MELLTKELIKELLAISQEPSLSLYMPTHRSHPENLQDPIRFKNLVKQMEKSLLRKYSADEAEKHLEPFEKLYNEDEIWNQVLDGLAVFSTNGLFKIVSLHHSVDEFAIVADSFHTKPLRQYLQSADHYHILGLSLHHIKLFEGNRHSLVEVKLNKEVSETITEGLGDKLTEKHTTVASYGGTSGESIGMHHGHGGKNDEDEKDAERFFRIVAHEIYENYSKPTGWPLVLAALPEHHNQFYKANKNPYLLPKGITVNPDAVSIEKLIELAWEVAEPEYLKRIDSLTARFEQARANGKGSDDYKVVAVAAVEGKVDTILVEADRIIAIRVTNLVTGNTQKKEMQNPRVDDLLDDMGELVMKMGGQVMVLPKEKMPSSTGLAAIFRY